jgi:hypothetical protein
MRAALIIACLIASNFLWQYLTQQNWELAADRSFYQTIAIAIYALYSWRRP